MNNDVTIAQLVKWGQSQLSTDTALLDAQVLLCALLDCSRAYLFAHADELCSKSNLTKYQQWIRKRATGYPLAYILGKKEFWSQDFIVSETVLIPRPDTEILVETVLAQAPSQLALQVVDLGTGSGAIACSLAIERPQWQVLAVDNSEAAIKIAKDNVAQLNLANVTCKLSDWGKELGGPFDVLVSNPPYLCIDDEYADEALQFEPQAALIAGPTGLECIKAIISQSQQLLKPKGLLAFEHGFTQAEQVRELMQSDFIQIHTVPDIAGRDRVTFGVKR